MKTNPVLNQLFLQGLNISTPFPPTGTGNGRRQDFVGKRFPTFFRFKGRGDGEPLRRAATLGTRVRVAFETDAEDSYFVRDVDAGVWNVRRRIGDGLIDATGWITTGPKSGVAQLWFDELPDDASPGSVLEYVIEVTDPGRVDAFQMELTLDVNAARVRETSSGTSTSRNANSGKGKARAARQCAAGTGRWGCGLVQRRVRRSEHRHRSTPEDVSPRPAQFLGWQALPLYRPVPSRGASTRTPARGSSQGSRWHRSLPSHE